MGIPLGGMRVHPQWLNYKITNEKPRRCTESSLVALMRIQLKGSEGRNKIHVERVHIPAHRPSCRTASLSEILGLRHVGCYRIWQYHRSFYSFEHGTHTSTHGPFGRSYRQLVEWSPWHGSRVLVNARIRSGEWMVHARLNT